jgi:predicted kinase
VVDGLWYWDYEQPYTEIDGLMNNIINVPPPIDCKKLVIIRGVSGSGKTTLAKKYLLKYGSFIFAEADQFMVDSAGNYSFNPKQLTFAHESCAKKVENAMKNEENLIVVSNTSIQYWEMYTYVILAQKYGYDLEFTETDTEWRYNPKVLFEKSNHSVPLETIHRQLENLKNNPTLLSKDMMIERILLTCGFRPTNYRPGLGTLFSKLIYYAFPSSEISEWIEKFKSHVGPERYSLYCRNKFQRDGGPADDGNILSYNSHKVCSR